MVRMWEEGECKKGERSGKVGGQSPGHTKTRMGAEKPARPSGPMGDLEGWGGRERYGTICLSEGSLGGLPRRQVWGDRGGTQVPCGAGGGRQLLLFPAGGSRTCGPPCSLQRLELPGNIWTQAFLGSGRDRKTKAAHQ